MQTQPSEPRSSAGDASSWIQWPTPRPRTRAQVLAKKGAEKTLSELELVIVLAKCSGADAKSISLLEEALTLLGQAYGELV